MVHMAVLLASMSLTNSFAFSQLAGAMTAVTSNYLLNNQLTFRDQRLRGVKLFTGYLEFLVISSVGVAANVAMATYTYNAMAGVALLAAFSGIALDTAWKYAVSSRFGLEIDRGLWRFFRLGQGPHKCKVLIKSERCRRSGEAEGASGFP